MLPNSLQRLAAFVLLAPLSSAQVGEVFPFYFEGSQDQVVPPVAAPSNARLRSAVGSLSGDTFSLLFSISRVSSPITAVELHAPAPPGANGPVALDIDFTTGGVFLSSTGSISSQTVSPDLADAIRGGLAYIDVHTVNYPDGEIRAQIQHQVRFCDGDGETPGCGACPCGNEIPFNEGGGCMNSTGQGARLVQRGLPSVTQDSIEFVFARGIPNNTVILVSGAKSLPQSGPCLGINFGTGVSGPFADGLRCVGGGLIRHGARQADSDGSIVGGPLGSPGWGGANFPPAGGLLAQSAFAAGQRRNFQAFYRDDPTQVCGTGQNTTNGVQILVLP